MSTELTNLLPESKKRAVRRQYFLRLGTLLLIVLALFQVLHAVMLLPTYLYAKSEVERKREELNMLKASAQDAGEAEVATRTARLEGLAKGMTRLESTPTASAALRTILAVARPGIALTGFTFTAPTGTDTNARMQIMGVASSRDALRQYTTSLGSLPFVTSADLPISAYAKESDIDFVITLTGSLRP